VTKYRRVRWMKYVALMREIRKVEKLDLSDLEYDQIALLYETILKAVNFLTR
jgi:DNA-directed RNA polymerase delta subunit